MKLRVNIGTEDEPESYLIDLDDLDEEADPDLKAALLHVVDGSGKPPSTIKNKKFGPYEVINGTILQDGYAMNEQLRKISLREEAISISVETV